MTETQAEYKVTDKRLGETKEVAVQEGPYAAVMMAMQKGYTPELIEKMMGLQERFEANEARKAYHMAMSLFKHRPPDIGKDKSVSYTVPGKGTTSYKHASLANVTNKINSALSEHGLSAAWKTEQNNGNVTVTCTITHKQGHSENTSLTAAPDTTGSKNSIQAIGSTISYLERYTILALTGLATHDMDDDGKEAGGAPGPFEQWEIKCDEAAGAKSEMGKWWRDNKVTVQKELSEAQAAKIYKAANAYKKQMDAEKAAPEPGSDG